MKKILLASVSRFALFEYWSQITEEHQMDMYERNTPRPLFARIARLFEERVPCCTTGYIRKLRASDFEGMPMPKMTWYGLFNAEGYVRGCDVDPELLLHAARNELVQVYSVH